MFEQEIEEIQSLFNDNIELEIYDVSSYGTYKITSINGQTPHHILLVSYYYDQSYLPFDHRTPGLRGKLTIFDKNTKDDPYRYGVRAAGTYRFFGDRQNAEEYHGYVEGEDRISIVDLLAWGYMCTFPNGNSVDHAVNDPDESYALAYEALGW